MSARTRSSPDLVLNQAVEWALRLEEGDLTIHERAQYDAWKRADPRHAEAISKLLEAARYFDVPRQMGIETDTLLQKLENSTSRRKLLRNMAVLAGMTVGTGWLVRHEGAGLNLGADFRTATGERRSYRLPDQSLITLNAQSAADIAFDSRERLVGLRTGMLMANVAHDGQRPFVIDTRYGGVRALGTEFQVRLLPDAAEVAVASSTVEIRTHSGATHQVHAGERAKFTTDSIETPSKTRDGEMAWLNGYYVALDTPLAHVIDALRPYRRGIIRVDPAVASMRVSAALPLDDTDQALDSLASTMPIEIQRHTPYWVVVSAR